MTGSWWVVAAIYLIGGSLVLSGLWIKSGPEIAMIAGGLIVLWFANVAFKFVDADDR